MKFRTVREMKRESSSGEIYRENGHAICLPKTQTQTQTQTQNRDSVLEELSPPYISCLKHSGQVNMAGRRMIAIRLCLLLMCGQVFRVF